MSVSSQPIAVSSPAGETLTALFYLSMLYAVAAILTAAMALSISQC